VSEALRSSCTAHVSLWLVVIVNADGRYQRWDWRGGARSTVGPEATHPPARAGSHMRDGRLQSGLWTTYFSPERQLPESERGSEKSRQWQGLGKSLQLQGAAPPRPAPAPSAPRGFRLGELRETDTYTPLLYRSTLPRRVTLDQVQQVALLPTSPVIQP
jgi:hypothetical protein